jgi:hypothetical protein
MNDCAYLISATARSCGIRSEVLPKQTDEDLALEENTLHPKSVFL